MRNTDGPQEWVRVFLKLGTRKKRKITLGILFAFWWEVWKERNRRNFERGEQSVPAISRRIIDEIKLHHAAHGIEDV